MSFQARSKVTVSLALLALSLTACGGSSGGGGGKLSTFPQLNERCTANTQIAEALRQLQASEITIDSFVLTMANTPNVTWTDTLDIQATNGVSHTETPSATAGAPADRYVTEKSTTFVTALNPATGQIESSADCGYSKTTLNGDPTVGSDMPETVSIGDKRQVSTATYTAGNVVNYSIPNQLELGQEHQITTKVEVHTPTAEELESEKKDLQELKANPQELIRKMKAGLEEARRMGSKIEFKAYRGTYNGKIALIFVGKTEFRTSDANASNRFQAAVKSQVMQVMLGL